MNRGVAAALGPHLVQTGRRQLQTMTGTPVVAGAGYNLDLGEGGTVKIYGTGAIVIRRSSVSTLIGVDRGVNDFLALAERTYLVGWDCATIGHTATAA